MRLIGIILLLGGLVFAAGSKFIGNLSFLPASLSQYSTYLGIGLFLAGLLLLIISRNSSGSNGKEVPIYHGKQIVGYRKV